jgi:hypothetical protein
MKPVPCVLCKCWQSRQSSGTNYTALAALNKAILCEIMFNVFSPQQEEPRSQQAYCSYKEKFYTDYYYFFLKLEICVLIV